MNPIELGKFIAQLRSENGLTQEELAEKLFIDKRKVSRWECGNSIPEFDLLIKLSEILDVSLYELSICQRINDEKISRRIINKFKNLKDLKKIKIKRVITSIILITLLCFFISTTIYTYKNSGTIEVFELESLDKDFFIKANYINYKDYSIIVIQDINVTDENINTSHCQYEIYSENKRISYILDNEKLKGLSNIFQLYDKFKKINILDNILNFKINCSSNKDNYSYNAKLIEIYNNRFF